MQNGSQPSNLSCIVVIPLPFKATFTLFILPTSVYLVRALHFLPLSTPVYSYGTHPFYERVRNISLLSDLLYSHSTLLYSTPHSTPQLRFYSGTSHHLFIQKSIHSWHSQQTSRNTKFISKTFTFLLLSLLIPLTFAPYNAVGAITPSYRHFSHLFEILYCLANFLALPMRFTPPPPLIVFTIAIFHPPSAFTYAPLYLKQSTSFNVSHFVS